MGTWERNWLRAALLLAAGVESQILIPKKVLLEKRSMLGVLNDYFNWF